MNSDNINRSAATTGKAKRNPWFWIPTLYFAQGLPYVAVMTLSVIMYKRLGISNTDIALYTGWLYLPWIIKPFWSPFVDIISTKRRWTILMQWLVAIGFAGIAFTIPSPLFFQLTLAIFWLVAFTSATHDIAADGYYMLALTEHEQSLYVGIRSTFYRVATVVGQGLFVVVVGILSALFLCFALYHSWAMPSVEKPAATQPKESEIWHEFINVFVAFFKKKQIVVAIIFMLLYRLPEAHRRYCRSDGWSETLVTPHGMEHVADLSYFRIP